MENLYFVYGPESLLKENYLARLGEGHEVVKKKDFENGDICWLGGMDLFSDSPKMLVIEKGELGAESSLCDFLSGCESLDGRLVICAKTAKENTKIYKLLSSEATVLKAEQLSNGDYEKFLLTRIKKYGLKIRESTYALLKKRMAYGESDTDLLTIDKTLWQLSFFPEVTAEAVEAFVTPTMDKSAFDLISHAGSDRFVKDGGAFEDDYITVLSAVAWALRLALRVKLFGNRSGVGNWQLAKMDNVLCAKTEKITEALESAQKGVDMIKSGASPRAAYLVSLALINDCFVA